MERRTSRGSWVLGSFILIGLLLALPGVAKAYSVSLAWDRNPEPDIAGYEVHIGTSSQTYVYTIDAGNVTTYVVSGLPAGETYYFAVTAYDVLANRSGYSDEVRTTITEEGPSEPASSPGTGTSKGGAQADSSSDVSAPSDNQRKISPSLLAKLIDFLERWGWRR